MLEEQQFFDLVAVHSKLNDLILRYCAVTDNGEEGVRITTDSEYGDAPPAGTYAILLIFLKLFVAKDGCETNFLAGYADAETLKILTYFNQNLEGKTYLVDEQLNGAIL